MAPGSVVVFVSPYRWLSTLLDALGTVCGVDGLGKLGRAEESSSGSVSGTVQGVKGSELEDGRAGLASRMTIGVRADALLSCGWAIEG